MSVMEQTKLDKATCEHVSKIINPMNSERIDRSMFAMAMHMLYLKKKQGESLNLPGSLPEEMLMSIDPEAFMQIKRQLMSGGRNP